MRQERAPSAGSPMGLSGVIGLPAPMAGWRRPQAELDESSRVAALEALVDLHTFTPGYLERMATDAGTSGLWRMAERSTPFAFQ